MVHAAEHPVVQDTLPPWIGHGRSGKPASVPGLGVGRRFEQAKVRTAKRFATSRARDDAHACTGVTECSCRSSSTVRGALLGVPFIYTQLLMQHISRSLHNGVCMTNYRCVATSVAAFIQQLAVSYVGRGYLFYATGRIPDGKDPRIVDAKLVNRYGIAISKWTRARRKPLGLANMQYIRHGRFFVLLSTHGRHAFFERERANVRDARRVSVKYAGYSVSFRNGHPHVRIDQREYVRLREELRELARHRSPSEVAAKLRNTHFEPYAPVRRQLLNLVRHANRVLAVRGAPQIPTSVLRFRRTVGPIFEPSPPPPSATPALPPVSLESESFQISLKRFARGVVTRLGPGDELGDIDPPGPGLAVVNPGLRLVQSSTECPLAEPGVLAEVAEDGRNGLVVVNGAGLDDH